MIEQIENGKKEALMCQEFGRVNSTIKTMWKNHSKLLVHLNRMDQN